jgi:formate hydrogenlyase subunit 3/multisubunit Na+/H+ antiporter MnhD subunit
METSFNFGLIAGTVLVLAGEFRALASLQRLKRFMAYSGLAQIGYILVGLSLGTLDASAGALAHLSYQLPVRAAMFLAMNHLAASAGGWSLQALRGAGRSAPLASAVLGFALFAGMGLTPFTSLPGKALIIHGLAASGSAVAALALAVAGVAAATYTVRLFQGICLENAALPAGRNPAGATGTGAIAGAALCAAVALGCLFPEPALHACREAAQRIIGGGGQESLPFLEADWPAATAIPFAGALLLTLTGRFPRVRDGLAVGVALATAAAAWAVPAPGPVQTLFTRLFALGSLAVAVYSVGYMRGEKETGRYWFFLFLMISGLVGLACSAGMGGFFAYWELMTLASYMLVAHKRDAKALHAAGKYFVMCASGALALQVALMFLEARAPGASMADLITPLSAFGPAGAALLFLLLLTGFAVKAGLFPLHSWLPAAHPVAPSSISAPLSGLLTKAGVLGTALMIPALAAPGALGGQQALTGLLVLMAAVTFVLGEFMALWQSDLKRMLAYSTLAQIGEITLVLCAGTWAATAGAFAHAINHAVMKDLLFLAAGSFILRAGGRNLEDLRGYAKAMPFTGACMAAGLISIMGLPPAGGFYGKYLMLTALLDAGQTWTAVLILAGSLVACVYYGRIIKALFFSPSPEGKVEEAPLTMRAATGALAGIVMVSGLFPGWWTSLVLPAASALFPSGIGQLPDMQPGWSLPALFCLAGAAAAILLRQNLVRAGTAACLCLALGLLSLLTDAQAWGALQWGFALMVLLTGLCNVAYSTGYMDHSRMPWRFLAVFSIMIAGLVGLAGAKTLIGFFFFWEIMSSWPLYFAIIHEESPGALREGTKYFLFNLAGASLMFLGILGLGHAAASTSFDELAPALSRLPAGDWLPFMALIVTGMLMKAAMLPVRIDWQMHPATAPTPVSGFISAMLLKCAPFGLVLARFTWAGDASGDAARAMDMLMYAGVWIGGVTILYAGVKALVQTGIKEMLIYSTVSQLGYIVLGVCLGTSLGLAGGLLHLFNHMLFKNLAFLCAGALMYATHAHDLSELGGIGKKMPITMLCFGAALFSAAGMPPFNGFTSKLVIYYALIGQGEMVLAVIAILSSVVTLAYFLKFLHGAFFGHPSPAALRAKDPEGFMRWPLVILACLCLVTGVFPGLGLLPVAGIEAQLGVAPPDVGLAGIRSGPGAFDMSLLSFMIILCGGGVWHAAQKLTRNVRRTAIHTCGETSLDVESTRIGAAGLYFAPLKTLARLSKGHFAPGRAGGSHD